MARSLAAASSSRIDSEHAQIIAWYEHQIESALPPALPAYPPVRIGPTWQYDNGWVLPRLTLGWDLLAWSGRYLRGKGGGPWTYTPEQARFKLWYYALNEDGSWLFPSVALQRLKGWGKDPVAAVTALETMCGPAEFDRWDGDRPVGREVDGAHVQVAAVSKAQTRNTASLFPGLVTRELRREWGVQVGKENVWACGDSRHVQCLTSSPLAIEGARPALIIRGETQWWNASNKGHAMAEVIEGNAAKSEGGRARILDIFNAYRPGEDSVAERIREGWEATQGDSPTRAGWGLLYDSLEAPPDAPLTAEAATEVVEAIRGDAVWLDAKVRVPQSILNPANPPSESRRKWYNQIVAAEDSWVTRQQWDAQRRPDEVVEAGEDVVLFLDGSKSKDSTALIGCRMRDGHVFVVHVWQRPAQADEWIVDRDAVDHTVREAHATWRVVGFWVDPSDARDDETGERFWEPYADWWARDLSQGYELVAVKTGEYQHATVWDMRWPSHQRSFVEAAERTATDIADGTLTHDGSALLAQHVYNARRRPSKWGVSLGKENRSSKRHVDAAVAMVGARMMWRLHGVLAVEQTEHDGRWWA